MAHDDDEDGAPVGFFTRNDQPETAAEAPGRSTTLEPLSNERITAVLDAHGYRYAIDSDGDIGGIWDDHVFYFVRIGPEREFLQVRGRWSRAVPAAAYLEVLELVNEWNTSKVFPKTYVRVEEDQLGVYAEHAVDYAHGLADEQLDQHLSCAVSTALAFFARLDEAYPQAVEEHRARIAAAREG
ncbi:YbjN domain-containing protein [Cellulomonas sp. PSBB021]|nr:YbjN domain-containing protein [Cellulomonas sp. PSBB021]